MLKNLSKLLFIGGALLIILSYLPSVVYSIRSSGGRIISEYILQTANDASEEKVVGKKVEEVYKPRLDTNLPLTNSVVIDSIGVETEIREARYENYEEALRKGVWRTPDFGIPSEQDKPVILAAHRYGYLAWSIPFRLKNSFYNLPKLSKGDTVEIIWRQRKYTYAVYRESEGEKIEDYSADLVLYTCVDLTSSVRVFRYAKLLRI